MPTLRIKEAAALLGLSDDTIRRWVEADRIAPASDGSGRLAVDGASLARFAQERAAAAHPPEAGQGAQSLRNRFPGLVTLARGWRLAFAR